MRPLPVLATFAAIALVSHASAQVTNAGDPPQPSPPAGAAAPIDFGACVKRFGIIGLPYHRSDNANGEQTGVVCRRGYALSFNKTTRNPDWVIERLTRTQLIGTAKRGDHFLPDPQIGSHSPVSDDFTGSGYDRGHQAPAADAKYDQTVMDESFFMSNMSPQVGIGFNRGQWKYLEESVRAWVLCGGRSDVIVVTGPVYGDSTRTIGKAGREIRVPEAYYKIVYDVRSERAIGFRLPNQRLKRTGLGDFIVPIADLETDTGLDFFRNLPRRRQTQLETSKGVLWGHDQKCSGVGGD